MRCMLRASEIAMLYVMLCQKEKSHSYLLCYNCYQDILYAETLNVNLCYWALDEERFHLSFTFLFLQNFQVLHPTW